MKIVKLGVEEKEITCSRCNSIISFHKYDIKTTEHTTHLGDGEYERYKKVYIVCPVCNKDLILEEKEYRVL